MTERKSLTKKVRFEVFKRDSLDDLIRYCKVVKNWTQFRIWITDLEPSTSVQEEF